MAEGSLLHNKRVLIIDDNADNIQVLRVVLRQNGAQPIVAWWTKEEIGKIMEHWPIDIILLDLMLPGWRNGYDVAEQLRAMPEFSGIPIVAVSARDPSESIPLAREKGFDGFIAKPIDSDRLPTLLDAVLRGEQIWMTE